MQDLTTRTNWSEGWYKLRVKAITTDDSVKIMYSKTFWLEEPENLKFHKKRFINVLVDMNFKEVIITHLIAVENLSTEDMYDCIY